MGLFGIIRPLKDGSGYSICRASDENVGRRRCKHCLEDVFASVTDKKQLADAKDVSKVLTDNGYEAFFVGGFVRDTLMKKPAKDIDITTNATPDKVQELFKSHVDTGLQHGTVSVRNNRDSEFFEVTTYRVDGKYEDGRHPESVAFVKNLKEDLARRDFTINAIAINPITNEVVDPFGGREDIQNGVIRCVGDAKKRFMEDPLRVLRAVRFSIKYGFSIEDSTKKAMHDEEVLSKLDECISKERITDELRKTLVSNHSIRDTFTEFPDILGVILPEMKDCVNAPHNNPWHPHDILEHILYVVDRCDTDKFEIKMAALLHDIGKPACRLKKETKDVFYGHPEKSVELARSVFANDLKVTTKEKERILGLIEKHDNPILPQKKHIRRFIANTSEDFVRDWMVLKEADLMDHKPPKGSEDEWKETLDKWSLFKTNFEEVIKEQNALKLTDLKVNGRDIMDELHIKPGPQIGVILNKLFSEVLDENIQNDKEALLNLAKTLL